MKAGDDIIVFRKALNEIRLEAFLKGSTSAVTCKQVGKLGYFWLMLGLKAQGLVACGFGDAVALAVLGGVVGSVVWFDE